MKKTKQLKQPKWEIKERVAYGAVLLSQKVPNWKAKIDLTVFDASTFHKCVLGQVFGGWSYGLSALNITESESPIYGFDLYRGEPNDAAWNELTEAWKALLTGTKGLVTA